MCKDQNCTHDAAMGISWKIFEPKVSVRSVPTTRGVRSATGITPQVFRSANPRPLPRARSMSVKPGASMLGKRRQDGLSEVSPNKFTDSEKSETCRSQSL